MEASAQHEIFITQFVEHGDHCKAAEEAGFDRSYGRILFTKFRERIQRLLEDDLAMAQVKAIVTLKDSMGDSATHAKQDVRLRAAESVLDRSGLGKKQTMEVGISALPAVMILPLKDKAPVSA